MKLLCNELQTELGQTVTVNTYTIIEGVRLHLYKHNNPAGSLFVEIRDVNDGLIATSETVAISSISAESFFHGQVRFFMNVHMHEDLEYKLVLCSSDYSFDESAYIGWCLDFEFNTYERYETTSITQAPQDYEIWQRK